MTSKRAQIAELKREIYSLKTQKNRLEWQLDCAEVAGDAVRDMNQIVDDLLLLLGKKRKQLPELRQAASAIRYAEEHEKQMAVAKDWTL